MLYHLVTGHLPFKGKSNVEVLTGHLEEAATPAHEVSSRVPRELAAVIERLMQKIPADRFQGAFDVIDEINRRLGTTFPLEDEQTRESYLECIRAGGIESRTTHLCSLFDGAIRSGETGLEIGRGSGLLCDGEIGRAEGSESAESARAPAGRLVVLRGEEGLGKRRLIEGLRLHARTCCASVVEVDCHRQGDRENADFERVVSAVRSVESSSSDRDLPDYLVRARELLCPPGSRGCRRRRGAVESACDVFAQGFAALGRRGPLLIVLHDVHRASGLLVSLLGRIVRVLAQSADPENRSLLVATATERGKGNGHAYERLYAASLFRRSVLELEVERLGRDELVCLMRSTFGSFHGSEELLEKLFAQSGGNPERLSDVLWALLHDGRIHRTPAGWSVLGDVEGETIPGKFRLDLEARIDDLPAGARRLAVACSCLGERVELADAVKLAGLGEDEAKDCTRLLRREKILEVRTAMTSGDLCSFVDPRTRDILYDRVSDEQRVEMQGPGVAPREELFRDRGESRPRTPAFHHLQGGDREKAIDHGVVAAREFVKQARPSEAIRLYGEVLEQVDGDRADLRASLIVELGELCLRVGRYRDAVTLLSTMCGSVDREGDEGASRTALAFMARACVRLGELDRATELLERVEDSADMARGVDEAACGALLARAELHAVSGEVVESLGCCERLEELRSSIGDRDGCGELQMFIAEGRFRLGDVGLAASYCRHALRLGDSRRERDAAAVSLYRLGKHYRYAGKLGRAMRQLETCLTLTRALGLAPLEVSCLLEIGAVHGLRERPQEALGSFEQATALSRRTDDAPALLDALCSLGETYRLLGEHEEASGTFDEAVRVADRLSNSAMAARVILARGGVHLDRGELGEVEDCLAEVVERDSTGRLGSTIESIELRSSLLLHGGRLQEALDCVTDGLVAVSVTQSEIGSTRLLARRGVLLCRVGNPLEARSIVVRLLGIARRSGLVLGEARARVLEGMIRVGEGNPRLAQRSFSEAERIFREQGSDRDLVQLQFEQGVLQLVEGRHESARRWLEEGLRLSERLGLEYTKVRFLYVLGLFELLTTPVGTLQSAERRLLSAQESASKAAFSEILHRIRRRLRSIREISGRRDPGSGWRESRFDRSPAGQESTGSPRREARLESCVDEALEALLEESRSVSPRSQLA